MAPHRLRSNLENFDIALLIDSPFYILRCTPALLDIVQPIEAVIAELKPQMGYTHFVGDLNRDHSITAEAVEIACRPLLGQTVSVLYAFETVSSTEWDIDDTAFMP